jgi:NAD+ synthase
MTLPQDIIDWIKDYSEKNNNLKLVVGVSGGVDSALVSTLCAMTGIDTHVVSMPIHQKENQLSLAKQHIEWLKSKFQNVYTHEHDLTESFEHYKNTMMVYDDSLGWANTRSRFRMITLYLIANYCKGIVVGTGNKVEDFGVGFFTKYGDGGVDISPIADLTKTEVRNMAKKVGVIDGIIQAKPTDGLWEDDRSDEDQIGASYEELEWAMEYMEQLDDRKKKVLKIYEKFHNQNEHKMNPIPVFKKTTTEAPVENDKGINLFQELFVEKNSERAAEYLFCINKNLENPHVNRIFFVINEQEYSDNKEYFDNLLKVKFSTPSKVQFIFSNDKRFSFNQMVEFSKIYVEPDRIVMVSNLDIFIPQIDSWGNLYDEFFKSTDKSVCMALARTEYLNDETTWIDEVAWDRGEFADAWIFMSPLKIKSSDFPITIPVGNAPSCDNYMFLLLSNSYDYVFNWADKYKIYHYDICRKPEVVRTKRSKIVMNESSVTLPQDIFKNSDQKKFMISAKGNWQELFNTIKK